MIVVTGHMVCAPDRIEEFTAAARTVVLAANRAGDSLVYSCSQSLTEPTVFVFVEQFADGAALRAHVASEHYLAFRSATDPIVTSSQANIHKVEKTRTV